MRAPRGDPRSRLAAVNTAVAERQTLAGHVSCQSPNFASDSFQLQRVFFTGLTRELNCDISVELFLRDVFLDR